MSIRSIRQEEPDAEAFRKGMGRFPECTGYIRKNQTKYSKYAQKNQKKILYNDEMTKTC